VSGLTPRSVLRDPLSMPVVIGEEFTVEEEALWEEFDTVSAGRFAQAAAGKHAVALRTASMESLTLTWDPGWLTNPDHDPERVLRELRKVLRKRAVFDLLIVNKPGADYAEFAGFASIRRLAITLKAGEPDTRYLQVDLSAHRRMSSRRRRHGRTANLPTTAVLDKNDTLRSLALHYYGSGEQWRLIARANGITKWGSETPLVEMGRYKAGDRIKIPARPVNNGGTTADTRGLVGQAVEVGE
jgi:nucleoid-associated protein YgaU